MLNYATQIEDRLRDVYNSGTFNIGGGSLDRHRGFNPPLHYPGSHPLPRVGHYTGD